jgi:P4 family phage/plasmid primase-like protien
VSEVDPSGAMPLPARDQEQLKRAAASIEKARESAGAEAVASVLEGARPAAEGGAAAPAGAGETKTPAAAAPARGKGAHRVTAEIIGAVRLVSDKWGRVFRYQSGFWSQLTDAQLDALAYNFDRHAAPSKRNDIVKNLRVATIKEDLTWGRVGDHEIACKNGILDVRTMKLRNHAPENYLERVLPIDWIPEKACPTWQQCLVDWFGDGETDGGRSAALRMYFGYIAMSHARWKKALLLYSGLGDTGKSVVALLAKMVVGVEQCCTLGVEHMDNPVRSAVLIGKALNVITEVSADAMIADGGFKTLVATEEPILIDAKYEDPILYVPTAKHIIVTNNLPRLNDHTTAVFNRLLIVPFDRQIAAKDQDRDLLAKLGDELEGVLVWLAGGARALVEAGGQWPEVPAARDVVQSYKDELNPIRQFIAERMQKYAEHLVPLASITVAFNRWNSGSRNRSIKEVGRLLRAAGFTKEIKISKYDGRSITCLAGWRFAGGGDVALYIEKTTGAVDAAGLEVVDATERKPAAEVAKDVRAMALQEDEDALTKPD